VVENELVKNETSMPETRPRLRFSVRDETETETLLDFLDTETRPRRFKTASRDSLETETKETSCLQRTQYNAI